MFGLNRWNSFDDVFSFQREVDRLFNQFWSDLPTRTAAGSSPSFQVNTTDDGWRVDVPLPGVDPKDVSLEVAGSNLTIRAVKVDGANARARAETDARVTEAGTGKEKAELRWHARPPNLDMR